MSERKKVVILGAGVTGLASAYRLAKDTDFEVHVIDKAPVAGGVCRSFTHGEFILDHGPHKFYTLLDGITEELCDLMGGDLLERDKTQSLYMEGKYFSFPLKMSEMMLKFPPAKSVGILVSYAMQVIKNLASKADIRTYEEFITSRFGKGLYQKIFEPMAKKIYGEPSKLDRKLAEVRISSPGLMSVIKQILFPSKISKEISAPKFHYPKKGFGMIPLRLQQAAEKNGVHFHLNTNMLNIGITNNRVSGVTIENAEGFRETLECDQLIYTIPVSHLANMITSLPAEYREAAKFTKYRHTIIYYFLLKSKPILPSMWVFFPEGKYRFGRVSEMVKFSPDTCPKDHTALMVDYTCEDGDPTWAMDDQELGDFLLEQMAPLKLFDPKKIVGRFSKRFKNFYPVYSVGYQEKLKSIRKLEGLYKNLYFVGRLGDFNYNNSDQCLDMGFRVADQIKNEGDVGQNWQDLRKGHFESYRIVD